MPEIIPPTTTIVKHPYKHASFIQVSSKLVVAPSSVSPDAGALRAGNDILGDHGARSMIESGAVVDESVGYGLALEGISAADVARSQAR